MERVIEQISSDNRAARKRAVWVLAIINAAALACVYISWSPDGPSFDVYRIDLDVYRIGAGVWSSGGALYGALPATTTGITLPFTYPPIAAAVMTPLNAVPMAVASAAMTTVTVVMLAVVVRHFLVSLDLGSRSALFWSTASLLPLMIVFEPIQSTLGFGQINVILMAAVTADILVPQPRWPRGMLIGMAAAIKLTPIVFVLYFVVKRDYRSAVVATATFTVTTALGFLLDWNNSLRYWTHTLFQADRIGGAAYAGNQSLRGAITRLGLDGSIGTAVWLMVCLAVVVVAAIAMRRALTASQPGLALCVNALAALLISPVSWTHHWVWLFPTVLVLSVIGVRSRDRALSIAGGAGFVVAILALPWRLPYGSDQELTWSLWQHLVGNSNVIYASAVLAIVAFRNGPLRGSPGREGSSLAAVSELLRSSTKTIMNYMSSLWSKLGAQRRVQAAALAAKRPLEQTAGRGMTRKAGTH